MAEDNSNLLLDGLKALNTGLSYVNPYQWLGRMSVKNNDYFEKGQSPSSYTPQDNFRRSFTDILTGVVPQISNEEAEKQIIDRLQSSGGAKKAKDYDIDLRGSDNQLRRVYEIVEDLNEGDARSKALADNNVLASDLSLPSGQNFATIQKPLFESLLRRAATRRETQSKLVQAGIDPTSVSSISEANEAIRKKATSDEIERQEALDESFENSSKGQREREEFEDSLATNQSNRDLTAQSIESSRNRDARDTLVTNQSIKQQNYVNERDAYEFEKNLEQLAKEREYNLAVQQAEFDARSQEIQMQNAADMERYQLMLQNDREVRRGDDISDLMSALTMLGGAFML